MKQIVIALSFIFGATLLITSTSHGQTDGDGTRTLREFREDRPRPIADNLPEELKEDIAAYRESKQALRAELRAALEGIEDAEERQAAIEQFRVDNADAIEAQKTAAAEIREAIQEYREENPRPDVEGLPTREDVAERRERFREQRETRRDERREFLESLEGLSEEERAAAIEARKAEIRERIEEDRASYRDETE